MENLKNTLSEAIHMMGFAKENCPKITAENELVILDDWIAIEPFAGEVSRKTIGGIRKIKTTLYRISILTHDAGVYRYADGSGQPPSDDWEEVGEPVEGQMSAVRKVIEIYQHNLLDNILETIGYASSKEDLFA